MVSPGHRTVSHVDTARPHAAAPNTRPHRTPSRTEHPVMSDPRSRTHKERPNMRKRFLALPIAGLALGLLGAAPAQAHDHGMPGMPAAAPGTGGTVAATSPN